MQARFETPLAIPDRNIITLGSAAILILVFLLVPWTAPLAGGQAPATGFQILASHTQSPPEGVAAALPLLGAILGLLGVVGTYIAPQHDKWLIRLSAFGGLLATGYFVTFFARNGADVVEAGVISTGFWIALLAAFVLFAIPLASLPMALLMPSLAILVLFLYYPTIQTFSLSLYRKAVRIGAPPRFVGLDNYTQLFNDPTYLNSIGITITVATAVILIGISLSLAIATLAMQDVRGATIYRTLLIWPYALSPAIAGVIFRMMFNEQVGLMRYVADVLLGVQPRWLSGPELAPWVIIAASVWKNLGYNILFYMAGLQNVPGDVLEAALIDGANRWQRFWRITFPLLSPMTFFLLFTNLTYSFFDIFGMIDITTKGGPVGATSVLVYKMYQDAFEFRKFGPAAAQAVVLFAIVIVITVMQFRFGGRRVHYGA